MGEDMCWNISDVFYHKTVQQLAQWCSGPWFW